MKKYIQKILVLCFVFIICPFMSMPIEAEEFSYTYVIRDEADLLSNEEEKELEEKAQPLLEYGNVIFSTVYLDTYNYEEAAEDTYYAYFGNEPGIHFQIDMSNRKLTLSCSTEMETVLSKERDSIVDNIYKLASSGDYAGCAMKCFDQVLTVLQDGKIAHTMKYIDNAILAILLALLINFIIVFARAKQITKEEALVSASLGSIYVTNALIQKGKTTKTYSPIRSSSSGSFHGGGSHGGSSGGGFSGGSSSHGF